MELFPFLSCDEGFGSFGIQADLCFGDRGLCLLFGKLVVSRVYPEDPLVGGDEASDFELGVSVNDLAGDLGIISTRTLGLTVPWPRTIIRMSRISSVTTSTSGGGLLISFRCGGFFIQIRRYPPATPPATITRATMGPSNLRQMLKVLRSDLLSSLLFILPLIILLSPFIGQNIAARSSRRRVPSGD